MERSHTTRAQRMDLLDNIRQEAGDKGQPYRASMR
jgi:hypothetical protein